METNHFQYVNLSRPKIIKDMQTFLPQYIEWNVFCKDDEEQKLVELLKPLSEGKACENIFVYGPAGSGKTTLIKHVLDHLKEYSKRVLIVYVNCWHSNTSMAIYSKIADELGETISRSGRASDEVFSRIVELIEKSGKPVLLVLDDIDALICRRDLKILKNISKINMPFSIMAISRNRNILSKIEEELRFTILEIKSYTKNQLFELLKIKAEKGLDGGSYDNELLEKIAEIGVNYNGNGRTVLDLLFRAARNAEGKCKTKIEFDDLPELPYSSKKLTEEEKLIVEILKKGERSSSEIYYLFSKKFERTKRQIRNYLKSLEGNGIVEIRSVNIGRGKGFKFVKLREVLL